MKVNEEVEKNVSELESGVKLIWEDFRMELSGVVEESKLVVKDLRVHSHNCSVRLCHEGRPVETRRDHKIGRGNRREKEIRLIKNSY
jgi:hypothetical protein